MPSVRVTGRTPEPPRTRVGGWRLTVQEAAHALPVLQSLHAGLRGAPAPRLAMIRNLARRSGIRDGALRTALSRACASGSLTLLDGRYQVGPQSREEAASARLLSTRTRGYVLGVVLEGAQVDLRGLHELFARLCFRPLQRSLWVGARTTDDRLGAALRRAGLGGSVLVFAADEVDADTRRRLSDLWGLADRAKTLRNFHDRLFRYLTAPGVDAREAAWRCVEAAPLWYRVAVKDEPPFPLDLCGADYPLARLNAEWRSHIASMTDPLLSLWTSEAQ